jgi:hypothetical protein
LAVSNTLAYYNNYGRKKVIASMAGKKLMVWASTVKKSKLEIK